MHLNRFQHFGFCAFYFLFYLGMAESLGLEWRRFLYGYSYIARGVYRRGARVVMFLYCASLSVPPPFLFLVFSPLNTIYRFVAISHGNDSPGALRLDFFALIFISATTHWGTGFGGSGGVGKIYLRFLGRGLARVLREGHDSVFVCLFPHTHMAWTFNHHRGRFCFPPAFPSWSFVRVVFSYAFLYSGCLPICVFFFSVFSCLAGIHHYITSLAWRAGNGRGERGVVFHRSLAWRRHACTFPPCWGSLGSWEDFFMFLW